MRGRYLPWFASSFYCLKDCLAGATYENGQQDGVSLPQAAVSPCESCARTPKDLTAAGKCPYFHADPLPPLGSIQGVAWPSLEEGVSFTAEGAWRPKTILFEARASISYNVTFVYGRGDSSDGWRKR